MNKINLYFYILENSDNKIAIRIHNQDEFDSICNFLYNHFNCKVNFEYKNKNDYECISYDKFENNLYHSPQSFYKSEDYNLLHYDNLLLDLHHISIKDCLTILEKLIKNYG